MMMAMSSHPCRIVDCLAVYWQNHGSSLEDFADLGHSCIRYASIVRRSTILLFFLSWWKSSFLLPPGSLSGSIFLAWSIRESMCVLLRRPTEWGYGTTAKNISRGLSPKFSKCRAPSWLSSYYHPGWFVVKVAAAMKKVQNWVSRMCVAILAI